MNAHVLLMFLFGCGGNQNPPYVAPMEVPAPDPNEILNEDSLPPPVAGGAPPEPSGSPAVADVDAPIDQPAVSFALSFLKSLPVTENVSFSPASLRYAFGMTYGGANENTAAQMELVFGFTSDSHSVLSNSLAEDVPGVSLANRVYLDSRLPLEEGYRSLLQNEYGAGLEMLAFAADPEGSRSTINQWVGSSTKGNVPELLPGGSVTPNTRLVLVNALHFLGQWVSGFPPGDTLDGVDFAVTSDRTVPVAMMKLKTRLKYGETEHWQVVELPYTNEFGMVVFLPKNRHGLEMARANLTFENYDAVLGRLRPVEVSLSLPRFEMQETIPVKETLIKMGLVDAFLADKANFTSITGTSELFVDNVFHQAKIAVDEKGTEASAATAVVINTRGGRHKPVPEMTVDHPFLFAIHDLKTKDILFVGQVVEP